MPSRYATEKTPHLLYSLVDHAVSLKQEHVPCCTNGCMAFSGDDAGRTSCKYCLSPRRGENGEGERHVVYWDLSAWLACMLQDALIGTQMQRNMGVAREAAAAERTGVRDWYDGDNFRDAVRRGYFSTNTCVALSLSTDGFEAWRQKGFHGWPVIATVLNLDPDVRVRNVSQILLCTTPGPRQPKDLDSFLRPVAAQLDALGSGITDVAVAGSTETHTLQAFVLQVTTDMPGGDMVLNASGHLGARPNRFRDFRGVYAAGAYRFPPVDPQTKRRLFSIPPSSTQQRSNRELAASAEAVESARANGASQAAIKDLVQSSGIKGYSLLFFPSPSDRARYPGLSTLWSIGPAALPYDPMHLILTNVVPLLWRVFAGDSDTSPGSLAMSSVEAAALGKEIRTGRCTVPLSQARSLRDIYVHRNSFKAVDWMYFLLCSGEAVLYCRISSDLYKMFMRLSRACRLLFRPSGLTQEELGRVEEELNLFCQDFYRHVYAGQRSRLSLCRATVAALPDVVKNVRSCGPAWSFWQFPVERYIGTLPRNIRSRSMPYAALVTAAKREYQAELLAAHGGAIMPQEWLSALGKTGQPDDAEQCASLRFPSDEDPVLVLLPPKSATCALAGDVLAAMRQALQLDGVSVIPNTILVRKYMRIQLRNGSVAGIRPPGRRGARHRRRDFLLRVQPTETQPASSRAVPASRDVYGCALFYAVVHIDATTRVFAYIECVKSATDRNGAHGWPERREGMDCFTSFGGRRRFVSATDIDAAVGTLFVRSRHVVLFTREPFSEI